MARCAIWNPLHRKLSRPFLLSKHVISNSKRKEGKNEDSQTKATISSRLQTVEQKSAKTYNQIAEETGLANVYVAQLLKRQLKPEIAPKLRAALPDMPEELLHEMMKPPLRSFNPKLILEPSVYRLNEAVMHFGESIKEIINEEFGDGINLSVWFQA